MVHFDKEAIQTRDYGVANNAKRSADRPDPSPRKKRLRRMTVKVHHYPISPGVEFATMRPFPQFARESMLRRFQQLLQILLPGCRPRVRAMTVGFVGDGKQHEAALFHALDLPLCDSEFRGVYKIVG